jgi:hypothetical protein
MFPTTRRSRRSLMLCAAALTALAVACDDEGTPPEPEPEVATIRVTVGTSTIDVPVPGGTHTPIPLVVNQANQVSFRFLGANGQDEPIVVAERADLVLQLENLATGWTFAATGGTGATFTATVTPTTTGSFLPRLELENTEHGHNEVVRILNVTVTQ